MIMKKQNKTNRWLAALLLLGAVMFTGCANKDNPVVADVDVILPDGMSTMELQPYQYEFELNIQSDTEWQITTEGNVCRTYPHEGSGNVSVRVRVNANDTEQERTGAILVQFPKAKSKNQYIAVKQLTEVTVMQDAQTDINVSQGVGYGYNIYTSKVISTPIANLKALDADNRLSFSDGPSNMIYKSITGSSAHELSCKLTTELGLKASYFGFTSEIKASFKAEALSSQSSEYAITYFYMDKYIKDINLATNRLRASTTYMDEFAYEDLNGIGFGAETYPSTDEGFKQLLNDYGTHFVKKTKLGARLNRSMSVDITKVNGSFDIAAFAKESYGGSIVSDAYFQIDAEYKESYEANKSVCETQVGVLGGDEKLRTKFYNSNNESDFNEWMASVDRDNARPVSYDNGDLIPLYELVIDADRREALRQYMESNKFKEDFGSVDFTYDYNIPGSIDVPTFKEGDNLIKEITVDGTTLAMVCNEFIPVINKEKRVTVVYPVVNNRTLWHVGYYVGSDLTPPAKVCTRRGSINVTTLLDDQGNYLPLGARKKLYIHGAAVADNLAADSVKGLPVIPVATTQKDYYVSGYIDPKYNGPGPRYGYGVVKIFDKLWLTYNLRCNSDVNNTRRFQYASDKKLYFYPESELRESTMIWDWRLPQKSDFLSIGSSLADNQIYDPAGAFKIGGVLGFQLVPVDKSQYGDHLTAYAQYDTVEGSASTKIIPDIGSEYHGCFFLCSDGIIVIDTENHSFGSYTPAIQDCSYQVRLCQDI